jgi:hypothetical protein
MNWEAIGAVGEALGAAGVIITLVYLARQIHQSSEHIEQNIRSQRLSASAALHHDLTVIRLSFLTDPELLRIFADGRRDPNALPPEERARFMVTCTLLFEQLAFAFDRREEGVADWSSFYHYLRDYARSPGVRLWWEEHGLSIFSPAFIREVEKQMAKPTDERNG